MTISDDDGAFSIKEFCDRYDIGVTATYAEINAGRLIVKKRGSRTLISRTNARAWFDALPGYPPKSGIQDKLGGAAGFHKEWSELRNVTMRRSTAAIDNTG